MANSIQTSTTDTTNKNPTKRRKLIPDQNHHHQHHREQPVIPGLPDHISQLCLSLVHPLTLHSVGFSPSTTRPTTPSPPPSPFLYFS
ncbi:unnamed protein product [Dovyalis caffra]|uniref:Uncharacterized protein n=1 Tax=Dovyalis caffra TaxID=77055 RepID=A0AAV1RCG0_9ROSI|nr:unnamed protein product [Dovyalis caffra]